MGEKERVAGGHLPRTALKRKRERVERALERERERDAMSSGAASAYWRVAGMSYLKYANLCADMVRAALKEPAKSNALKREVIFYRGTKWAEGKPGESVLTDFTQNVSKK